MKKIISVFLAAAAVFTMGVTAFAKEETNAETKAVNTTTAATITFDTEKSLDYIHTFGNASETNLTCEITDEGALGGKSLKLSEDFSQSISNRYGGIYFEAADFGLESFAGYTMKININPASAAAKATDKFEFFSDGEQWSAISYKISNPDMWSVMTISVPASVDNSKMGVSFPITEPYSGDLIIIDDLTLTDNYGKKIDNIGDVDTSLYQAPSGAMSVLTTILFLLLIIVVILGIGYFAMKVIWAYR